MSARPRIVEVVGPAGAGKSTLCRVLAGQADLARLEDFPDVRKLSDAPFFLWNGLRLLPSLVHARRNGGRLPSRRELAWLAILRGWPARLQSQVRAGGILFLDQGPVYLLTETRDLCPAPIWQDFCALWAATLDLIVWLDAPDADLLTRIRTREKAHVVKHESDEAVFAFLDEYRQAYARALSSLTAGPNPPQVLRFDTGRHPPEEIASQLLTRFIEPRESP